MTPRGTSPRALKRPAGKVERLIVYRILTGPLAGQIVPEDDTCPCEADMGGCDGTGRQMHARRDDEWEEGPCAQCGGVGRVLGYPEDGRRPSRLELVENEPARVVVEDRSAGRAAGSGTPKSAA